MSITSPGDPGPATAPASGSGGLNSGPGSGFDPAHHGGGKHLSSRAQLSIAVGLVVALLVLIFAAQNGQGVEVHFLTLNSRQAPLFVVTLAAVLLGVVIGAIFATVGPRRRH